MAYILESASNGELTRKAATEAAQTALNNVSMQASRERRKAALQNVNPRLTDMAEDGCSVKATLLESL